MKYIKKYEYKLSDIENVDKIKSKKYLTILEFYAILASNNQIVNLNIPIDIYYKNNIFSENKISENARHFYEINKMWISTDFPKKQNFKDFNEAPYFIVELLSDNYNNPYFDNRKIEKFIIRENHGNELIIDAIYNYILEHEEILTAYKYNI